MAGRRASAWWPWASAACWRWRGGTALGKAFVSGDGPDVTYTAARCADLREYAPTAPTCAGAAAPPLRRGRRRPAGGGRARPAGPRRLAGRVRPWRGAPGSSYAALPEGFGATVGAALFGLAALVALPGGLLELVVGGSHAGAGNLLSAGLIAAVAFAGFTLALWRSVTRRLARACRAPAGEWSGARPGWQRTSRGARHAHRSPGDGHGRSGPGHPAGRDRSRRRDGGAVVDQRDGGGLGGGAAGAAAAGVVRQQAAEHGEVVVNATGGVVSLAALRPRRAPDHLAGKALVDVSNPMVPDSGFPPRLEPVGDDSLAEHDPARPSRTPRAVKALNTMNAQLMIDPGSRFPASTTC